MNIPKLVRTLSHNDIAEQLSEPLKKIGKNQDTILNNYFVMDKQIIFSYLKNNDGIWSNHVNQLDLSDFLKLNWTHNVCPFKIEEM